MTVSLATSRRNSERRRSTSRIPKCRRRRFAATVSPRWFACDALPGDMPNRRRLVRFQDLDPPKRVLYIGPDGKKREASPIRFVCGCENGHLQDADWRRVVHQKSPAEEGDAAEPAGACRKAMWQEDSGTSADPRDTRITCECGPSLTLEELAQPGRLGKCPGERPWIAFNNRDPNGCDKALRLLTRSATNTYFPQVARVISLPQAVDALARSLAAVWTDISECRSVDDVRLAKKFNSVVRANLQGYSDDEIIARILLIGSGPAKVDEAEDPKIAEYQLLSSGRALIGANSPDAHLHAETLSRAVWDADGDPELAGIHAVVAVHRLREVACLYGFTRFEPAPLANDDLEDVGLAVRGAPLGDSPDWLPAIEQFGEGIFIQFSPDALSAWLGRPSVLERSRQLQAGVRKWADAKRAAGTAVSQTQLTTRTARIYHGAQPLPCADVGSPPRLGEGAVACHEASEHWRDQFSGLNCPLRCFARRDFSVSDAVSLSPQALDCEPDREGGDDQSASARKLAVPPPPPPAAKPFAVGIIAHLKNRPHRQLEKQVRQGRRETPPAMRRVNTRLSQGFCWYDLGGDSDRDRVRQVYANEFVARRIQIGLYASERQI